MSSYITPNYSTRSEFNDYNKFPLEFKYYNINSTDTLVVAGDEIANWTTTGTITAEVKTQGYPVVANINTVYSDTNTEPQRPIAHSYHQYPKLTVTGASSASVTSPSINLSEYDYIVVIAKSETANREFKVTLSSGAGQTSEIDFTNAPTPNTWVGGASDVAGSALIAPFRETNASEGVTVTGTVNWGAVTINIEQANAGNVSIYEIHFVKERQLALGTTYVIPFSCLKGLTAEETYTYVARMCNRVTNLELATESVSSITVETTEKALSIGGATMGNPVSFKSMKSRTPTKEYTVGAGGVITLPSTNKVSTIATELGVLLFRGRSATTVTENEYVQSGVTVTVNPVLVGQNVLINQEEVLTIPAYDIAYLPPVILGQVIAIKTTSEGNIEVSNFDRAQIKPMAGTNDDAGDIVKFSMSFLTNKSGVRGRIGLR